MAHLVGRLVKIVEFIFFGNYFYALCVLSLAFEASIQQGLGLNVFSFYTLLCSVTIVYYTYAYMGEISLKILFTKKAIHITPPSKYSFYNQRTRWYQRNTRLLQATQLIFLIIGILSGLHLALMEYKQIFTLHLSEWLALFSVPLVAVLYYGNAFFPIFKFNLRKSGWLKPFVVGFVWAGTVTLYPPMFHKWEMDQHFTFDFLTFWFLIKNWMYITVLAIMFDIKDYADDANRNLKTFVVQVGLRATIFNILLPLTFLGLVALTVFGVQSDFSIPRYLFNIIPFILLLWVAYSMHQRKPILFYLIIIDGLMFVKGICGIMGTLLFT